MLTPARAQKIRKLKTDIKLDRQLYLMMIPALISLLFVIVKRCTSVPSGIKA